MGIPVPQQDISTLPFDINTSVLITSFIYNLVLDRYQQQQPVATSQHSDPKTTLSCFITCPQYQVLRIQVASMKLAGCRCGTGEKLSCFTGSACSAPSHPSQQCHCTWFNRCSPGWWDEHPPGRGLSAPQVPRGDFFLTLQRCIFRTAGFDLGS